MQSLFQRALRQGVVAFVVGASLVAMSSAMAGEVKLPWEEYDRLIKGRSVVASMGPDLFGDRVNLYNSTLSFSQTDISLPGNNALPVALTRTYAVGKKSLEYPKDMPMADWDLDLPSLSGVFATTWHDQRCSGAAKPPNVPVPGGNSYTASDYWHGNQADMPYGGEMLLAGSSTQRPGTGGPYYWMTPGFTYFSCLPTIGNGSGEGFLAIAPDGTKYWFNWMAQYYEPHLDKPVSGSPDMAGQLARRRNVLHATRVEDRFGNWVTYSFSNSATAPARLNAIEASDGRKITLTYNAQGHVQTASDGSHTWTYQYGSGLTGVVLPDGRSWTIDFAPLWLTDIEYDSEPSTPRSCDTTAFVIGGGTGIGRMTHPSGAVGEFEVGIVYHGRTNVPKACANWEYPVNNPNNDVAVWPRMYDLVGLQRKRITGPGLEPMEWNYSSGAGSSWAEGTGPTCQTLDCAEPKCLSDACAGTAVTIITGPNGQWTRYVHGNSYRYNEGKLLRIERGGASGTLRTETISYNLAQSGQPFPTPIGTSPQSRGDGFTAEYLRPQTSRVVTQDGVTFSSSVASTCNGNNTLCFDAFARPLAEVKGSSLNPGKTDAVEYHNDLSKWVLWQVKRTQTNGVESLRTDFDTTTALPIRTYKFGKVEQTLSYNTDGTVATVSDGRDGVGGAETTITLSNWKRGIPQTIQHPATQEAPAGTIESAVVNADGTLASVTDENGSKTCYGYDAMGRLTSITHPSESTAGVCDTSTWTITTQTFAPVAAAEYGLPAGHWKQTVSTGNARKVTYFDALWRPVVDEAYDNANPAATRGITVKRYDVSGRLAFQSYPLGSLVSYADTALTGTTTTYDALDRATRIEQHSELGPLVTTTEYLSGFKRRTTNPRQAVTTESFHAFDVPTYDLPVQIDAAEGTPDQVRTVITRDVFGKPLDVARGEGG